MKISVIIPTYNCADFVDETIASVVNQNANYLEMIIVEDGSTDDTVSHLKEYEKNDNIKILYNKHSGSSCARNAGLDVATGEYVAFMDCDDCLTDNFFNNALPLIDGETDLYIFSFDRVECESDEKTQADEELIVPMVVEDRTYKNVSDYADHYIRDRHLLVYSACNKIYRKSVIDEYHIRFNEEMSLGEDRMFNYEYLIHCGQLKTSQLKMFRYMQRNPKSASKRSCQNYFDLIMKLHKAKMDCFFSLSKGTTQLERDAFKEYDILKEINLMMDRFKHNPEEKNENLPKLMDFLSKNKIE